MGRLPYTWDKLEEIIMTQLDNLDAMNDLICVMKEQTDLITRMNKKLRTELDEVNRKVYQVRKWPLYKGNI